MINKGLTYLFGDIVIKTDVNDLLMIDRSIDILSYRCTFDLSIGNNRFEIEWATGLRTVNMLAYY